MKLSNEQIDQFVELCNHGEYIELEKKLREVLGGNIPNALLAEITTARGVMVTYFNFVAIFKNIIYPTSNQKKFPIKYKIRN